MNRWLCRGAINKTLLVVLGVIVVAGAAFWVHRWRSNDEVVGVAKSEFTLYCASCNEVKVSAKELKKLPWESGPKYRCPKCGKFTLTWSPPSNQPGVGVP